MVAFAGWVMVGFLAMRRGYRLTIGAWCLTLALAGTTAVALAGYMDDCFITDGDRPGTCSSRADTVVGLEIATAVVAALTVGAFLHERRR